MFIFRTSTTTCRSCWSNKKQTLESISIKPCERTYRNGAKRTACKASRPPRGTSCTTCAFTVARQASKRYSCAYTSSTSCTYHDNAHCITDCADAETCHASDSAPGSYSTVRRSERLSYELLCLSANITYTHDRQLSTASISCIADTDP